MHYLRPKLRGSPTRRLGLVCSGATRQRAVLASSVTSGNKLLLLLLLEPMQDMMESHSQLWVVRCFIEVTLEHS